MKIFHHCDADGRGAAAVISRAARYYSSITRADICFVECDHTSNIVVPEIKNGESVFFVDLAWGKEIIQAITEIYARYNPGEVIILDHHKSTVEAVETLDTAVSKVGFCVSPEYSGMMLAYLYVNYRERLDEFNLKLINIAEATSFGSIPKLPVDFNSFPAVVKYIDDNDRWVHKYPESKHFALMFGSDPDTSPSNDKWDKWLNSDSTTAAYVNSGALLYEYQANMDAKSLKRASFEFEFEGYTFLCMNSVMGNSRIFGDAFDKYAGVIKFGFTGNNTWTYTLYGSKVYDPNGDIDLSTIAKKYGGGGHAKACGFTTNEFIFAEKDHDCVM